jgi:hypothetical protein
MDLRSYIRELIEESLLVEERSRDLSSYKSLSDVISEYSGQRDVFVHFSEDFPDGHKDINQMSINVNQHKKYLTTPFGIYGYPINNISGDFKTDAPTAYIFRLKPSAKIFNLSRVSDSDLRSFVKKLYRISDTIYEDMENYKNLPHDEKIDYEDRFSEVKNKLNGARNKSNGGLIYYAIRKLSKNAITITNIWKKLGYDGLEDEGDGIIHYEEPAQVVVFSSKHYEVLDVVSNKNKGFDTSGETLWKAIEKGKPSDVEMAIKLGAIANRFALEDAIVSQNIDKIEIIVDNYRDRRKQVDDEYFKELAENTGNQEVIDFVNSL